MTRIDKEQLEKISGGTEGTKNESLTGSAGDVKIDSNRKSKEIEPAIINPVVRPGEPDS